MITAHWDKRVPRRQTDVRRQGKQGGPDCWAPGISDNGTGTGALVMLARAFFRDAKVKTN